MTVPSLSPALSVTGLDEACSALRGRGLRLSAARRLVLEALFAADGPVTAELIADGLDGRVPRSDLTSVYRNLEAFEELGLVRHVHLGHGPGLYALAGDREYLVCETCDRVRSVPSEALDGVRSAIRDAFGYEARFSHFPIVGQCPDCSSQRGNES
jgi:Fur family ferric uptake transcriptional regulator